MTMYLNDHQRSAFYEALGLNTTQFCRHVIIETNNTSKRIFPEVRPAALQETCGACWKHVLVAGKCQPHVYCQTSQSTIFLTLFFLALLFFLCCLQVPTVDSPVFWDLMDKMVSVNNQLSAIDNGTSTTPALLQPLAKLALLERMGSLIMRVMLMTPIEAGSYDFENKAELVY
jgi:hypothetical protein